MFSSTAIVDGDYLHQTHEFECPLDYNHPENEKIRVIARSLYLTQDNAADNAAQKPWLVFFQGGPGFGSPQPDNLPAWVKRALQDYRILFLDQRGTGQSTPATAQTLAHLSPVEQAEYLSHFRADNIVRDAEFIRQTFGVEKWAILGQSFGGFCAFTYLSLFPNSLEQVYVTGGVPTLNRYPDAVYHQTYKAVRLKNQAFFLRFPKAQDLCKQIADHLQSTDEYLPNGQKFDVLQFQLIGIRLGTANSELALYQLLENAFVSVVNPQGKLEARLSDKFLQQMLIEQSTQVNPLYAILHESIYCHGYASLWSAQRVFDSLDEFHYPKANSQKPQAKDFMFVGEMIYPWMFERLEKLKPLKEAAEILAQKKDWPKLYDREVLANNKVPVSCAVYAEDMYVPMELSRETLEQVPFSKAWITNEYEHDGLRQDGERILDKLFAMGKQTQEIIKNQN